LNVGAASARKRIKARYNLVDRGASRSVASGGSGKTEPTTRPVAPSRHAHRGHRKRAKASASFTVSDNATLRFQCLLTTIKLGPPLGTLGKQKGIGIANQPGAASVLEAVGEDIVHQLE
jgi:hypothetical protein